MPLKAGDHLGTAILIGPYDLTEFFGVELTREDSGVHQVTKQHRELAPFRGERWDHGWGVALASGGLLGDDRGSWLWRWRSRGRASARGPDQATPPFIDDLGMGKENGLGEIGQVVIVKRKLALQGTVRDPAVLL
jgi:hypothetical protein